MSQPRTILVADDDATVRLVLGRFLGGRGHRVIFAEDGVQACELAELEPPDVILLDLMLPRRDGYAVLLHLRARPGTRATPVFLVSGDPSPAQQHVAETLGAQGFIGKPFDLDVLAERVEGAFGPGRAPATTTEAMRHGTGR